MREPGNRTDRSQGQAPLGASMAKGMSQASEGLSTAFGFVAVVLVFWLGGRGLDNWLGTEPWFQIVGAVVGWVLGVIAVIYSAQHRAETRSGTDK
jgi:F0F1-type ATP synthase assembly protein I